MCFCLHILGQQLVHRCTFPLKFGRSLHELWGLFCVLVAPHPLSALLVVHNACMVIRGMQPLAKLSQCSLQGSCSIMTSGSTTELALKNTQESHSMSVQAG